MSANAKVVFKEDDRVWKKAEDGGYEGPGRVAAVFKNWMGQQRYVIEHVVAGGTGCFYHIYSGKQLMEQPKP